jgi:hypothetical protein
MTTRIVKKGLLANLLSDMIGGKSGKYRGEL